MNVKDELAIEYIRASGPGGQNVNKVSTAAQLRFDVVNSTSLSDEVKSRLVKLAGKKVSNDGILIVEARRFRTQEQNREDVLSKFFELLKKAKERPKVRRKTKPTKASKEKRLQGKKVRSQTKKFRRGVMEE